MARSHARIDTGIWNDKDFKNLSRDGQWLYKLLLSQPDLGHSGLLSITVRRWARLASDATQEVVSEALYELAAARFVVIDEDTEELLVRSLVRNDGAWKQPKVLGVAITEASRISSAYLRAEFALEMSRLEVAGLSDKVRDPIKSLLANLPAALTEAHLELEKEGGPEGPGEPPPHGGPEAPSEGGGEARQQTHTQAPPEPPNDPHAEGDRGRVRAQAAPTPTPTPAFTPPAAGAAAPPTGSHQVTQETLDGGPPPVPLLTPNQRSKRIADAYAEAEPMCKWPAVNAIVLKAILDGRWSDADVEAACLRLAEQRRSVTIDSLRNELTGPPQSNVRQLYPTGGALQNVNDADWSAGFNLGGNQ